MNLTPFYGALTAFVVTYLLMPRIISMAKAKRLYDVPNGRSVHKEVTPSLGGIGIFAGLIFAVIFWSPFDSFEELKYILGAFLIIFLFGVRDDIIPLSPRIKLVGQLLSAGILVFFAGIRLTSLYGVFGVHQLPDWVSIILSMFTYVVIINSFNLIDGINGLAGSIAALVTLALGTWFLLVGDDGFAILSFSLFGAVLAFLKYNYTPARIFMGDTGSLLLGATLAVLAIHFIEYCSDLPAGNAYKFESVPALMISLLVLPLFDTLRVFVKRMLRGRSPFSPDRMHIHHILLDLGLSHMQATVVLVLGTVFFVGVAWLFQSMGNLALIALILVLAISVTELLSAYAKKVKANSR